MANLLTPARYDLSVDPLRPLATREQIIRLESAADTGKENFLASSASSLAMWLAAVAYFFAVVLVMEELYNLPASTFRWGGASLGRMESASGGPFGSVLNLLGQVGVGLLFACLISHSY